MREAGIGWDPLVWLCRKIPERRIIAFGIVWIFNSGRYRKLKTGIDNLKRMIFFGGGGGGGGGHS